MLLVRGIGYLGTALTWEERGGEEEEYWHLER